MYGLVEEAAPTAHRTDYEKKKETEAARQRTKSAAGREIGEIPPCLDPELRAKCEESLEFFALTCFPGKFTLKLAQLQRDYIHRLEYAIRSGGRICDAMPRGTGKTTIARVAVIWAILCGYSSYALLVGATGKDTNQNIDSLKNSLTTNKKLAELWPEACYPFAALKQTSQRANGQTCQGEPTHIRYRKDVVVFPTIQGSKCSGAIIEVASMGGTIRGRNFDRPDGTNVRPDLCFLDDVQTKKSARSDGQVAYRESIIKGDVLGLAGPGERLAVIMVCTVIRENDLSDRFLDREKNPTWRGRRIPMFLSRPTNEKLWDVYREMRAEEDRVDDDDVEPDRTESNRFYVENQNALDAGAVVTWPDRVEDGEISGIQHAMNKLFDLGEEEFAAEYQNEPIRHQGSERPDLTPKVIEKKIAGPNLPRGKIPLECDRLVSFIDCQDRFLLYEVLAVGPGFGGHTPEYGTYPAQDTRYFTARNARRTLRMVHQGEGLEGAIYAGIHALADYLHDTEWEREDGVKLSISPFVLIDEGDNGKTVQRAVRDYKHKGFLMTAKGMGLGPADTPLRENKAKPGENVGEFWHCRPLHNMKSQRRVLVDTNEAKTFAAARIESPKGDRGSITIYHETASHHQMKIDHMTAETRTMVSAKGREKETWKNDNRKENHFWDTFVGCCVAASTQGYKLQPIATASGPKPVAKRKPRKRVSSLF